MKFYLNHLQLNLYPAIERPLLTESPNGTVKFDFRYHIIVQSFSPLKAYAFKRFWPKLAVVPYNLDIIEDLQRHLTNIAISDERTQPWYTDLIKKIEKETKLSWENDIEKPTLRAIKDILYACATKLPPEGIAKFPNSRYCISFSQPECLSVVNSVSTTFTFSKTTPTFLDSSN